MNMAPTLVRYRDFVSKRKVSKNLSFLNQVDGKTIISEVNTHHLEDKLRKSQAPVDSAENTDRTADMAPDSAYW